MNMKTALVMLAALSVSVTACGGSGEAVLPVSVTQPEGEPYVTPVPEPDVLPPGPGPNVAAPPAPPPPPVQAPSTPRVGSRPAPLPDVPATEHDTSGRASQGAPVPAVDPSPVIRRVAPVLP